MDRGMGRWLGLAVLLGSGLLASAGAFCQEAAIPGVWRGTSTCMVAGSACHDEVNVYRITAMAGKPGWFSVSGDKIVDGREEVMGTGEWHFDEQAHELICEFARGVFRLKLDGKKMEGTLKLPDGRVYRRIQLEKEK